jgi:hypothetical protein
LEKREGDLKVIARLKAAELLSNWQGILFLSLTNLILTY